MLHIIERDANQSFESDKTTVQKMGFLAMFLGGTEVMDRIADGSLSVSSYFPSRESRVA